MAKSETKVLIHEYIFRYFVNFEKHLNTKEQYAKLQYAITIKRRQKQRYRFN